MLSAYCYNIILFRHDMESIFGTNTSISMTKSERILYSDSYPTHAMVLTGFHEEVILFYVDLIIHIHTHIYIVHMLNISIYIIIIIYIIQFIYLFLNKLYIL